MKVHALARAAAALLSQTIGDNASRWSVLKLILPVSTLQRKGHQQHNNHEKTSKSSLDVCRRRSMLVIPLLVPSKARATAAERTGSSKDHPLLVVNDPKTYQALAYAPPPTSSSSSTTTTTTTPPLILVLHGAGKNDLPIIQDLADPKGEHAGLIPSLIASGNAPSVLLDNFAVLAPYSSGRTSYYGDPRGQLLDFVDWAIDNQNTATLPIRFDPDKIVLFGFSDGATVAVELMTTRRFRAGIVCSYGYSGKALPSKALERLVNLPMWVFHSQDDVIFDVANSDRLVKQLRTINQHNRPKDADATDIVRYSRFTTDPENLPRRVRGHSMGITASESPDVYEWLLTMATTATRRQPQ